MRVCPKCGSKYLRDEPFCNKDGSQTQNTTEVLSDPGSVVGATLGNYHVQELLGVGGMGRVYRAEHSLLGRAVALKILHEELSVRPELVQRFFNEARAVNQIRHENIIDITDFGTTPDGTSYFVMELLEGLSLDQVVRDVGVMNEHRALHILVQMADALSAAHSKGIIHRDLKPANVLLVPRSHTPDFVKLLDFGIAKLMDTSLGGGQTRTGVVIGTPTYMSPEQATGQGIDERSDVYSFGIIMYRLLGGRTPFSGDSLPALMRAHVAEVPTPLSELNSQLSARTVGVVMRCLEKIKEDRFQSMDELHQELKALGGTHSRVDVPRPSPSGPMMISMSMSGVDHESQPTTMRGAAGEVLKPARSRWPLVAAALLFGGAIAGGVGFFALGTGRANGDSEDRAVASAAEEEESATRLLSEPEGALVFEGGEELGTTPLEIDTTDEDREVTLRLEGHREKTIVLAHGSSRKMRVTLRALDEVAAEEDDDEGIEILEDDPEVLDVDDSIEDSGGTATPVDRDSVKPRPKPRPVIAAKPRPSDKKPVEKKPDPETSAPKKSPFGLRD